MRQRLKEQVAVVTGRGSRTIWSAFVVVGLLSLLFFDFHLAYVANKANAMQTTVTAKGQPGTVGSILVVRVSGSWVLAHALRQEVMTAVRAKELPFREVRFVTTVPADAYEHPFLAIHLAGPWGWSPVVAGGRQTAIMQYIQGQPVDREAVLHPVANQDNTMNGTCAGPCALGRRTVTLSTSAFGLISWPHMQGQIAGNVAAEAATLVADSLPENLNPAKWFARAGELARKQFAAEQGGVWSTFQRIEGCRGGVAVVGQAGSGTGSDDWSIMYYDADQDAITQTVSRQEIQAQWPDRPILGNPGIGGDKNGLTLYVPNVGRYATFPPGQCSLRGSVTP